MTLLASCLQTLFAVTASVDELGLIHASGNRKRFDKYLILHVQI
jgi:hypothetical protein